MQNLGKKYPSSSGPPVRGAGYAMGQSAAQSRRQPDSFKNLSASELYCPRCKRAMPVRERMLLVLSRGDLYDYLCTGCGESLGTKTSN